MQKTIEADLHMHTSYGHKTKRIHDSILQETAVWCAILLKLITKLPSPDLKNGLICKTWYSFLSYSRPMNAYKNCCYSKVLRQIQYEALPLKFCQEINVEAAPTLAQRPNPQRTISKDEEKLVRAFRHSLSNQQPIFFLKLKGNDLDISREGSKMCKMPTQKTIIDTFLIWKVSIRRKNKYHCFATAPWTKEQHRVIVPILNSFCQKRFQVPASLWSQHYWQLSIFGFLTSHFTGPYLKRRYKIPKSATRNDPRTIRQM